MKFCPHCGGDLSAFAAVAGATPAARPGKYDQTKIWKGLIEQANACGGQPPDISALAFGLAQRIAPSFDGSPLRTIVHVAFDRKIVPEGGALYQAAMSNGRLGPTDMGYFRARGYLIEDDKVRVVGDMPVGAVYGAVDYWGGDKQHKRWRLAGPVVLNASRNGDPFFMDETMLAFGATWTDGSKVGEALLQLFETLSSGVGGSGSIARPLAAEISIQA